MRQIILIPFLLLAACEDGADDAAKQKTAAKEASRNLAFAAGQWESTAEVTRFSKQDQAPKPAIDTPVGSKSTASVCVTAAQAKEPPTVLLAGDDAYDCTYDNKYISSGSLNAALVCKRQGVTGEVRMAVNGTYTADTLEAEQNLTTYLPGSGDIQSVSKISARRTGECAAEPAKG